MTTYSTLLNFKLSAVQHYNANIIKILVSEWLPNESDRRSSHICKERKQIIANHEYVEDMKDDVKLKALKKPRQK